MAAQVKSKSMEAREEALNAREEALNAREEALIAREEALRAREEASRAREKLLKESEEALAEKEEALEVKEEIFEVRALEAKALEVGSVAAKLEVGEVKVEADEREFKANEKEFDAYGKDFKALPELDSSRLKGKTPDAIQFAFFVLCIQYPNSSFAEIARCLGASPPTARLWIQKLEREGNPLAPIIRNGRGKCPSGPLVPNPGVIDQKLLQWLLEFCKLCGTLVQFQNAKLV